MVMRSGAGAAGHVSTLSARDKQQQYNTFGAYDPCTHVTVFYFGVLWGKAFTNPNHPLLRDTYIFQSYGGSWLERFEHPCPVRLWF